MPIEVQNPAYKELADAIGWVWRLPLQGDITVSIIVRTTLRAMHLDRIDASSPAVRTSTII